MQKLHKKTRSLGNLESENVQNSGKVLFLFFQDSFFNAMSFKKIGFLPEIHHFLENFTWKNCKKTISQRSRDVNHVQKLVKNTIYLYLL